MAELVLVPEIPRGQLFALILRVNPRHNYIYTNHILMMLIALEIRMFAGSYDARMNLM